MRVEPNLFSRIESFRSSTSPPTISAKSHDSIEHFAKPLWIVAKIKQVYRKIVDFFRGILSRFFPVEPYMPVSKNQITYHRAFRGDNKIYRLLVDGVSTDNEIEYREKDGVISLIDIRFADQALRAHLGLLFTKILKDEEAQAFSTNRIEFAKLLWNCGFTARGAKVRYYPDSENYHQMQLNTLIDMAKERREKKALLENVHGCLVRIESAVSSQTIMDSFVDIAASMNIVDPRPSYADIELCDIFRLMDAMDIENMRGVTFETAGGGWSEFQESP